MQPYCKHLKLLVCNGCLILQCFNVRSCQYLFLSYKMACNKRLIQHSHWGWYGYSLYNQASVSVCPGIPPAPSLLPSDRSWLHHTRDSHLQWTTVVHLLFICTCTGIRANILNNYTTLKHVIQITFTKHFRIFPCKNLGHTLTLVW